MLGYGCMGQVAIGQGPYALPFPPAIFPDGGYGKKKKRQGPDPIDLELKEKASRRAALELAVYGPEVVDLPLAPVVAKAPTAAPDVSRLVRFVLEARQAEAERMRQAEIAADEDDLESILKDIL